MLAIQACGRTELGDRLAIPNGAGGSTSAAGGNSGKGHACKWKGFAAPATYENYGSAMDVGDLNADGRLDLVSVAWGNVTTSFTGNGLLNVYLQRSDGSFAGPSVYNTDMEATSVALADFDSDGKLDVAVVNVLYDLDIFLNQGGGALGALVHHSVPPSALAMASADFNRDGHADLAVTTQAPSVDIHLGDGAGSFATPSSYQTSGNNDAIAVGDLNGDGYSDIVVSGFSWAGLCGNGVLCLPTGPGPGTVNVLLNQGDGTLAPQTSYDAGNGTASVALGDFNGDHALDIVAANGVDRTLSVWLNQGDGSFAAAATLANPETGTSSSGLGFSYLGAAVATGDFNGDGHVDIALAQDSASNRTGTLYLFINQGDGSFADPASYSLTAVPYALVSADWNRDGLADLALSLASGTQLYVSQCE